MEYLRRRLVEEALREGYNLTSEAISILESQENPLETLRQIIRHLKTSRPEVIIVDSSHIKEVGLKIVDAGYPVSDILIEKAPLEEWVPNIEIDERFLEHYKIEGEIDEFKNYFKNRYLKLKSILEKRGEAFSKIIDVLKNPKGSEATLAVMLMEKIEKEQSILLQVEDDTGAARLVAPRKDAELARKVEKLVADQVFGVKVSKVDNSFIVRDVFMPDIPMKWRSISEDNIPEVYIALISDLHVGSKKFRRDLWESFLDWLSSSRDPEVKRLRYIVVAGDIVDGVGVFPKQEKELEYTSIIQQIDEVAKLFSEIPKDIRVIISVGNHDPVVRALPQPPLPDKYRKRLEKDREYIFVGNPAYIKVENRSLLVYHGQSLDDIIQYLPNTSYSMLDREIKNVLETLIQCRHLAPIYGENTPILPTPKDMLVVEDIPDILHTGHVHVAYVGNYREVVLVNSGTWQEQTSYQREVGLEPTVGTAVLVNLKTLSTRLKKFA